MSSDPTRVQLWLQVKSPDGLWTDCGPDLTVEAIFKNIEYLQRNYPSQPDGHWRCIKRTTSDEVVVEVILKRP